MKNVAKSNARCSEKRRVSDLSSFHRLSLKSEARRFSEKSARPPSCECPLNIQRHLLQLLAIRICTANSAHSSVSALLFTTTAVGSGAMNNYETVSNGAVNCLNSECCFSLYMQRLNERSAVLATARWCLQIHVLPITTTRWLSWPRSQLGS